MQAAVGLCCGSVLCHVHNRGFILWWTEGQHSGLEHCRGKGVLLQRWFSFTWQFGLVFSLVGPGWFCLFCSFIPNGFKNLKCL